jgi:hypothetical protein
MHMTWMAKARNRAQNRPKPHQKREKTRKNAKLARAFSPAGEACSEKTARALAPRPLAHNKSPKIHPENSRQKVIHNPRLL